MELPRLDVRHRLRTDFGTDFRTDFLDLMSRLDVRHRLRTDFGTDFMMSGTAPVSYAGTVAPQIFPSMVQLARAAPGAPAS